MTIHSVRIKGPVGAVAALVVLVVSTGCASTRAARRAELYERARSILAGLFLQAADIENLAGHVTEAQLHHVFPNPPWDWFPAIEFRRIRAGLYLVALSEAASGTPSSLYLFDGPRYIRVDSGVGGVVQVDDVFVKGDRVEVAYFPTPSRSAPVLTSAVLEKSGAAWRVDCATPYRQVTSLLARFSHREVDDPNVHRHPRLLEAFGLFLENAGRLSHEDLWRHMSHLFPAEWHQAWPTFDIRRVGLALYVVEIERKVPTGSTGSLYVFDGASYVTLASDDTRAIVVDDVAVSGRRIEVRYARVAFEAPDQPESVIVEQEGQIWRVTSRERLTRRGF